MPGRLGKQMCLDILERLAPRVWLVLGRRPPAGAHSSTYP